MLCAVHWCLNCAYFSVSAIACLSASDCGDKRERAVPDVVIIYTLKERVPFDLLDTRGTNAMFPLTAESVKYHAFKMWCCSNVYQH